MFENSRPASPRFFGYVFGSGEPVGALGEFAASVLHQNAAAWRSAPAAVTIERTVIRWLASAVGCAGFSGSLTLGGSSANLMGLCMAREAKAPANHSGVRGGVIYCSAEAHMSIPKAAALLGLGHEAVRLIAVDEAFRMRTEDLHRAIEHDLQAGKLPIAVVASAGTTATGSIDPLNTIADICHEFGLWLHVDGAYGALASLAIPDAFSGMERADSLSLIRTNGSISPLDAVASSTGIRPPRSLPSPTRESMRAFCLTIPSKGSPSSRNRWNSQGHFER